MQSFNQYLIEKAGGKKPGKLEIHNTTVNVARSYAVEQFAKHGFDLDEEIPNFDNNFVFAKNQATYGKTLRKEMPVLEKSDIRLLQRMFKKGSIDLSNPWSSDEVAKDPFPEGLSGKEADQFFERGLKIHDGAKSDDVVKFKMARVPVKNLIPIQKQIYVDKSINRQSREGAKKSRNFLENQSIFVASSDLRIIDGHHRFFSALMLDPNMKVKVMLIDLPIDKLLPLTVAFSDAVGNKRNG